MGRYQWELFVLCGFGWFADKYVEDSKRIFMLDNSMYRS